MTSALVIERKTDAEYFLAAAQDWLLEAETENNLLLGIALNHRGRAPTSPPSYWATVLDANTAQQAGALSPADQGRGTARR